MTSNPSTVQRSRLVAVITEPIAVRDMPRLIADLEAEHGKGLTIRNGTRTLFEIRTPGVVCGCGTCAEEDASTYERLTGGFAMRRMIVCADCGNKRCPKATHHDQECTASNLPGQPGSRYA